MDLKSVVVVAYAEAPVTQKIFRSAIEYELGNHVHVRLGIEHLPATFAPTNEAAHCIVWVLGTNPDKEIETARRYAERYVGTAVSIIWLSEGGPSDPTCIVLRPNEREIRTGVDSTSFRTLVVLLKYWLAYGDFGA